MQFYNVIVYLLQDGVQSTQTPVGTHIVPLHHSIPNVATIPPLIRLGHPAIV